MSGGDDHQRMSIDTEPASPLPMNSREDMRNGVHNQRAESIVNRCKKLEDDLKEIGITIKHREDKIKYLKSMKNEVDESILELQGKYYTNSSREIDDPEGYAEIENQLKETKWKKDKVMEDIQTEQALLDNAMFKYETIKREFLQFLDESESQVMPQVGRGSRPR